MAPPQQIEQETREYYRRKAEAEERRQLLESQHSEWMKKHYLPLTNQANGMELRGWDSHPFAACVGVAQEQFLRSEGALWRRSLPDEAAWSQFAASEPGWGGATACKLLYVVPQDTYAGPQCIFLSKELPFHYDLIQLFAPIFAKLMFAGTSEETALETRPWPRSTSDFNQLFYAPQSAPRAVVLAGITRYPAPDKSASATWALDLNPGDFDKKPNEVITDERRASLQGLLCEMTRVVGEASAGLHGGALRFHPQSFIQRELMAGSELGQAAALLSPQELFANITYQPLLQGTAVGVVHLVPEGESTDDVPRDAICVCESVPLDLPPVRALLTAQMQTPLAHTALLCANRGTPNAALPGQYADLAQYNGQHVKLVVGPDKWAITPVPADQLPTRHAPPKRVELPMMVGGPTKLMDITESHDLARGAVHGYDASRPPDKSWKFCGAKARQCGQLHFYYHSAAHQGQRGARLPDSVRKEGEWPIKTCPGCVIPFAFAEQHFRKCEEARLAAGGEPKPAVQPPKGTCDRCDGPHWTEDCRAYPGLPPAAKCVKPAPRPEDAAAVLATPVDPEFLLLLRNHLLQDPAFSGGKAIFRSSTNAEDLPGFNGAGLYDSVPVRDIAEDEASLAAIDAALRKVWSSLWTRRARAERGEFGIPEENVRVAVLVQPFVEDSPSTRVLANGVAVTNWSPESPSLRGVYLNAVAGAALRATDADLNKKGAVTEQCTVITSRVSDRMDVKIMDSIGGDGNTVLNQESAVAIASAAWQCGSKMSSRGGGDSWDIEWMVVQDLENGEAAGTPEVILLQARPFTGAPSPPEDKQEGKEAGVRRVSCREVVREAALTAKYDEVVALPYHAKVKVIFDLFDKNGRLVASDGLAELDEDIKKVNKKIFKKIKEKIKKEGDIDDLI